MSTAIILELYAHEIRQIFGQATQKRHVIWLSGGADTGCTISVLQAAHPDLIDAVVDLRLSADFWQALMTCEEDPRFDLGWWSAGYESEDTSSVPLANAVFGDAPVDVLIVEGTIQTGAPKGGAPGEFCIAFEHEGKRVTVWEVAQRLYKKAAYVMAFGQCSAFGNIPSAKNNITGSMSLVGALNKAGVYHAPRKPVITIPGCPGHPDVMLLTLASVLQGYKPDLDEMGRPRVFFNQVIHDSCPRRGYFDRDEFAKAYDEPQCLYELGCKGPITLSHCAITKWNSGVGFCTEQGPMCWGCMHPSFPDSPAGADPTQLIASSVGVAPALVGVNVNTAILAAGAATAVGIGAYAVRKKRSTPREEPGREGGAE
jgi:NiFe hydrogenase small subunit HydA